MSKHITIDLGTSNTVISSKDKGILLNEPSVVAIDLTTKRAVAVGSEAKELLDKTPKDISVITPLKNGVVSDFDLTCAMLKSFLGNIFQKSAIRPKTTVCLMQGMTDVESKVLTEAISRAGAKVSYTLDAPISAFLGMGIDIASATGNMILDIGGGKTAASVISFGGIVAKTVENCGGDEMDALIVSYIKENFGIIIGKKTAEDIKISIGTAEEKEPENSISVMGRDERSGLPKEVVVTDADINKAIMPVLLKIIKIIKDTLYNTPAELMRDIDERGIFMCGGVSRLRGLDKFIKDRVDIFVTPYKSPDECIALGGCTVFDTGVAQ